MITETLLENDLAIQFVRSNDFLDNFDLIETKIYTIPPILFYTKLYMGEVNYYHGGSRISVYENLLDDLVLSITFQSMLDENEKLRDVLEEMLSNAREFSYLIDTEVGDGGEFKYPFLDLLTEHISRNLKMVMNSNIRTFREVKDLPTYVISNSRLVRLYQDEADSNEMGCLLSRFKDMLFVRIIKEKR